MKEMYDYSGERFISKLYKSLHDDKSVKNVSDLSDSKVEKVKKYFDSQEDLIRRSRTHNHLKHLYSLYHEKYCIKKDNLKGNKSKYDEIRKRQEESMDKWLDYLLSETTNYPMWFKYFVFQKMLKIGNYNEVSDTYLQRRNDTISPFIECDPEIIAKIYDVVVKTVNGKEITDMSLESLVQNGSFDKLYILFINKKKKELSLSDSSDGTWIKYNEGSIEDAKKLYLSIQGKNTGWCTAGESMAISQVCGGNNYPGGDFYVYYTKDNNGKYTMPRIAIRMDGKTRLGEIRGIDKNQNLEEGLEDIVKGKLDNIPNLNESDKARNLLACNDAKTLTLLNRKTKNNIPLSKEELAFIFELERGVKFFGWIPDERIEEIKKGIKITNRDFAMKIVSIDGNNLKYLDETLKKDREIVMAAICQDVFAFNFAALELQQDKKMVMAAIENGFFLLDVDIELQKDKEIVMAAVNYNEESLQWIDPELMKDREFILSVVSQNGMALEFLDPEYQKDKEIVMAAVSQNGMALEFASESLTDDFDILLAAMQNCMDLSIKNKKR